MKWNGPWIAAALVLAAVALAATSPAQGAVGYTPPAGSVSCWSTAWNGGEHRCHVMDLTAHAFAPGQPYNPAGALARYGYSSATCPTCHAYADGGHGPPDYILRAMCLADHWGTAATHDCYPTLEELYDYAHVDWSSGWWRQGGGATGGQPAPGERVLADTSCCPASVRCEVEAGHPPGWEWRETVRASDGRRLGCYLRQPLAGESAPDPTPLPSPVPTPTPEPPPALCWACPAYTPVPIPARVLETLQILADKRAALGVTRWGTALQGRVRDLALWVEAVGLMYVPAPLTYTQPVIRTCLEHPELPGVCEEDEP